jgi:hypothetical protein
MARSEARIFTDVWNDAGWRGISRNERSTYVQLLTQEDLTHCGVIPLREGLWAAQANVPLDEICQDIKALESVGWLITDYDTRELFVRSLIRRDKVLRQPKLWKPLAESIRRVFSPAIKRALLAELLRTWEEGGVNEALVRPLSELIEKLNTQVNSLSGSQSDSLRGRHAATQPDRHPDSQEGEGARYVRNQTVPPPPSPFPLTPSPAPGSGDVAFDADGAPLPDEEGEGDFLRTLTAEVRAIRPDWSTSSIRRALTQRDVSERPPVLIRRAMLAVAADPESQHPGRLAGDGPWWHIRPPPPSPRVPVPHCGQCSPSRHLEDDDGNDLGRCPRCHQSTWNGGQP